MSLSRITTEEIIKRTQQFIAHEKINPGRDKYRELVLIEAEKHVLQDYQVRDLARHLNIDFPSPPRNARGWKPSICKMYQSIKYTNPNDEREWVVTVTSKSLFGIKGIIHRTPNGYLDTSWFSDFVLDLAAISASYENGLKSIPEGINPMELIFEQRGVFTQHVNKPMNRAFSNGLSESQLRATHAFFFKYLPGVEGICKRCFRLNFPLSGAGARWLMTSDTECDVRLSEPKVDGYECQQRLYLTHSYRIDKRILHVRWNGIYTDLPTLVTKLGQPLTHISWASYNYEKLVESLSVINQIQTKLWVCQCKKIT